MQLSLRAASRRHARVSAASHTLTSDSSRPCAFIRYATCAALVLQTMVSPQGTAHTGQVKSVGLWRTAVRGVATCTPAARQTSPRLRRCVTGPPGSARAPCPAALLPLPPRRRRQHRCPPWPPPCLAPPHPRLWEKEKEACGARCWRCCVAHVPRPVCSPQKQQLNDHLALAAAQHRSTAAGGPWPSPHTCCTAPRHSRGVLSSRSPSPRRSAPSFSASSSSTSGANGSRGAATGRPVSAPWMKA